MAECQGFVAVGGRCWFKHGEYKQYQAGGVTAYVYDGPARRNYDSAPPLRECVDECNAHRFDDNCEKTPQFMSECEHDHVQVHCAQSCCLVSCKSAVADVTQCDRTVAYAFMTRDVPGFWPLWAAYFATCAFGDAVPLIHTQGSSEIRGRLERDLAPFGGRLVPWPETVYGYPRWSWRMMPIEFALYRLAGRVRGRNGCRPKWVHLLSEADVPVRPCPAVHQQLAWHPGVSRISLFNAGGPFWNFGEKYNPVGHTEQWTTLALPHALALAGDAEQEQAMQAKWGEGIYQPDGWDVGWIGFDWPFECAPSKPTCCPLAPDAYARHLLKVLMFTGKRFTCG